MTFIEYNALMNCYNSLTNVLLRNLHCGDEDEIKHIQKLTLKDISDFLSGISATSCEVCKGKGIVTDDFGTKTCPRCKGKGGHFNNDEIDCTL